MNQLMKTIILCGGQGTRLREETEYRPKPMVDIGGKPILWHIMKTYANYDVSAKYSSVSCVANFSAMTKTPF
jgi:NDP-sugar pyrophosphorylase family protein